MTKTEILGVYAEKDEANDGFVIKRGYDKLLQGKRVVILEDILTTGGSVRKVVDAVKEIGSPIVGVAAICNRGGISAKELGDVPQLNALLEIALDSWEDKDCPLCKKGVAINTDVGKGREYLAKKKT